MDYAGQGGVRVKPRPRWAQRRETAPKLGADCAASRQRPRRKRTRRHGNASKLQRRKWGTEDPEEPRWRRRTRHGEFEKKGGAEEAKHRPQRGGMRPQDPAQKGRRMGPWMRRDPRAPAGHGCGRAEGGRVVDAAADFSAGMQPHSQGRSVGNGGAKTQSEMEPSAGLGCSERRKSLRMED